ncbi:MAG: YlqD family protein [Armatimonadota bacterium]
MQIRKVTWTMLVKQNIAVKIIVTDEFKEKLLVRLQSSLRKVEGSLQMLEHQGRRFLSESEGKDPAQVESFRNRLERQIQRQEEIRTKLAEELVDAETLKPGDEYSQGSLEGLVEIRVGDNLSDKLRPAELIIENDLVKEIR